MKDHAICNMCGRESSSSTGFCEHCGFHALSGNDDAWAGVSVGAPSWGRIVVRIIDANSAASISEMLRQQWDKQELFTQQVLFPYQSEKFLPNVSIVHLFAPMMSFNSLQTFISSMFPANAVESTYSEMSYDDIDNERDNWLSSRRT